MGDKGVANTTATRAGTQGVAFSKAMVGRRRTASVGDPDATDRSSRVRCRKIPGDGGVAGRERLAALVKRVHTQGRTIRFWNTPEMPKAWRVRSDAGVDRINTDRLTEPGDFLRAEKREMGLNAGRRVIWDDG